MYIYSINVVFDHREEDYNKMESEIERLLEPLLKEHEGEIVSTYSEDVSGDNFGKCQNCGCWTSDKTKDDYIWAFSNGAKIDGKWYCDICLPPDHPNAF